MSEGQRRRWARVPPEERSAITAAARASSIERRAKAMRLLRAVEQLDSQPTDEREAPS